jgi:hypothetical protein
MAPIGLNQDTSKGVAQGFRGSTWAPDVCGSKGSEGPWCGADNLLKAAKAAKGC